MLACCTNLVLGQFGPYTLPIIYHMFFFDLLSGVSVLTALLLALFLHEEKSHLTTRLPRRPILITYRWTIAPIVLLMAALWASPILIFLQVKNWKIFVAVLRIVFYFPLQCVVSAYFIHHAWNLGMPLWAFATNQSNFRRYATNQYQLPPSTNRVIARLAFWLALSAGCMITSCGFRMFFTFIKLYTPAENSPSMDSCFICLVFFVLSRTGVSFAQVRAVRSHPFRFSDAIMLIRNSTLRGRIVSEPCRESAYRKKSGEASTSLELFGKHRLQPIEIRETAFSSPRYDSRRLRTITEEDESFRTIIEEDANFSA